VTLVQFPVASQSITFAVKSIMPLKRQTIGRATPQAQNKKALRASEIIEQREARLKTIRVRIARSRQTLHADLNLDVFYYDVNYDYSLQLSVVLGKIDKLCVYCNALKFKNEKLGLCCACGKVKLPELHSPPEQLSALVSDGTSQSKYFLANIRK